MNWVSDMVPKRALDFCAHHFYSCGVNTNSSLIVEIDVRTCFNFKFVHKFVKAIIQGESGYVDQT